MRESCDSLAHSVELYGPYRGPRGARNRGTDLPALDVRRGEPLKGVSSHVAEVKIQEGESIESALRRFKRKVQQEDIIKDIKKHSFYLKPGDRRRAKQALARKRTRKKQRRESD
jgi:small subunit ribosomal protein S21